MPQRRLLYIDANHLAAYEWRGGRLLEEGHFLVAAGSAEAFRAYLERHPRSHFYIMADVAEEGFHFDTVPHVGGKDRKVLLERRLGQYFYGSRLAAALPQGRERTGRRDERILFAALTRPEMFEPWLACLRSTQARVAGLYSLPLVSACLVRRIAPGMERCLLVSVSRAGMRQSYFEKGNLRFSRLSPLQGSGAHEVASLCAVESAKTYQYLVGQRLIPRGTAMPTLVLTAAAQHGAFAGACQDTDGLHFEFIDLQPAARACGVTNLSPEASSEELFLQLLVRRPPREQFAGPTERRYHRLWETRFAIVSTAAVALLACLLFATGQAYELIDLRRETLAAQALADADTQRHRAMTQALPATPTSLDNMRAVLSRYDVLEKRSVPMEVLLRRIAAAVDQSPAVEIERIDWTLTSHPEQSLAPEALLRRDRTAGENTGMFSVAVVSGVLSSPPNDPRGVLDTINAFVGALRRDPTLQVGVLRLPFDAEPGKYLRGNSDSPAGREHSRFTVRVSYKQ